MSDSFLTNPLCTYQYSTNNKIHDISPSPSTSSLFSSLCSLLSDEKVVLRAVGGWVRDRLLGLESSDVDFSVEGKTEKKEEKIEEEKKKMYENIEEKVEKKKREKIDIEKNIGKKTEKNAQRVALKVARFLAEKKKVAVLKQNCEMGKNVETSNVRIGGLGVDFVDVRKSPADDAKLRDFTINAIFYNLSTSSIEDFTGKGVSDLCEGVLRTPGEAKESLGDDKARILRVLRFALKFKFRVDEEIIKELCENKKKYTEGLITSVSPERLEKELSKIFCLKNSAAAVNFLAEKGYLKYVLQIPNIIGNKKKNGKNENNSKNKEKKDKNYMKNKENIENIENKNSSKKNENKKNKKENKHENNNIDIDNNNNNSITNISNNNNTISENNNLENLIDFLCIKSANLYILGNILIERDPFCFFREKIEDKILLEYMYFLLLYEFSIIEVGKNKLNSEILKSGLKASNFLSLSNSILASNVDLLKKFINEKNKKNKSLENNNKKISEGKNFNENKNFIIDNNNYTEEDEKNKNLTDEKKKQKNLFHSEKNYDRLSVGLLMRVFSPEKIPIVFYAGAGSEYIESIMGNSNVNSNMNNNINNIDNNINSNLSNSGIIHSINEAKLEKILSKYKNLLEYAKKEGLADTYSLKPLLSGKEIISLLHISPGKIVRFLLDELVKFQISEGENEKKKGEIFLKEKYEEIKNKEVKDYK